MRIGLKYKLTREIYEYYNKIQYTYIKLKGYFSIEINFN